MNHYDPRYYQHSATAYGMRGGRPHGAYGVLADNASPAGYFAIGGPVPNGMPQGDGSRAMRRARKISIWPAVLGAVCLLFGLGLAAPAIFGALNCRQSSSRYGDLAESAKRDPSDPDTVGAVEAAGQSVARYHSQAVGWGALSALSFGAASCCFVGGFFINRRR